MGGTGDKRRRQWYASSIMGGFSRTEQRLREAWGCEGAYFWRLLLDAAAREVEPGSFTYRTDAEAWTKFGVIAAAFSLDEFFALTGRMRQTTKATRNRITVVDVTNWDEWQNVRKRQPNADQTLTERRPNAVGSHPERQPITDATLNEQKEKPRSEAQSTDKVSARCAADTDAMCGPTVTDTDTAHKPLAPAAPKPKKERARDHVFEALLEACGIDYATLTESGRGPINRGVRELKAVAATPAEIHRRAGVYRRRYPEITLTPSALVKHWGALNDSNGKPSPEARLAMLGEKQRRAQEAQ